MIMKPFIKYLGIFYMLKITHVTFSFTAKVVVFLKRFVKFW